MLDFYKKKEGVRFRDKTANLSKAELSGFFNEMTDTILGLIAEATDADVVFQPSDPGAYDGAASTSGEEGMAWSLGHVIVHLTASNEEGAFLAAELARGVEAHGRSRYETHWEMIKTIDQARQHLEDSRHMCLATLAVWPPRPHLDNVERTSWAGDLNACTRFMLGLYHANSHLAQIVEIVKQAKEAR